MVDRTRSKDEAARLFWMQGAVMVEDTKRSVAILAVVSLLLHRGPRCSRSAGAYPWSSVEESLLPSRSSLRGPPSCLETQSAFAQQQATETALPPWHRIQWVTTHYCCQVRATHHADTGQCNNHSCGEFIIPASSRCSRATLGVRRLQSALNCISRHNPAARHQQFRGHSIGRPTSCARGWSRCVLYFYQQLERSRVL